MTQASGDFKREGPQVPQYFSNKKSLQFITSKIQENHLTISFLWKNWYEVISQSSLTVSFWFKKKTTPKKRIERLSVKRNSQLCRMIKISYFCCVTFQPSCSRRLTDWKCTFNVVTAVLRVALCYFSPAENLEMNTTRYKVKFKLHF